MLLTASVAGKTRHRHERFLKCRYINHSYSKELTSTICIISGQHSTYSHLNYAFIYSNEQRNTPFKQSLGMACS